MSLPTYRTESVEADAEQLRRALFKWAEERRRREVAEEKLADAEEYISRLKHRAPESTASGQVEKS